MKWKKKEFSKSYLFLSILGSILVGAFSPSIVAAQSESRNFHIASSNAIEGQLEAEEACNMSFGVVLMRTNEFIEIESPSSLTELDLVIILSAREVLNTWFYSGQIINQENGNTIWQGENSTESEGSAFIAAREGCGEMAEHFLLLDNQPSNLIAGSESYTIHPYVGSQIYTADSFDQLTRLVDSANNNELVEANWDEALTLFSAACNAGEMLGCAGLGRMYRDGNGVERDFYRSITHYQQACGAGIAESCNYIGRMYREGQGVNANLTQAAHYFRQACENGASSGCNNLGRQNQHSPPRVQDVSRFINFYQGACDQGIMSGCVGLGYAYQIGDQVDQDHNQARWLYQNACEANNMNGCARLGELHELGEGVEQDYQEALSLYQYACENGSSLGCDFEGTIYRDGLGVDENLSRARALFHQACSGGNSHACGQIN